MHLAGETDSGRLDAELGQRCLGRAPPVLGILLRPAGLRRRKRVRAFRASHDLALGRECDRLDPGGPDVEPGDEGHRLRAECRVDELVSPDRVLAGLCAA